MSNELKESALAPAHVSTVPKRSPLRYPGGKTWFIPHARAWLGEHKGGTLIEAFAGGATTALTAIAEGLSNKAILIELDADIAAFWREATNAESCLAEQCLAFEPTIAAIEALRKMETTNDAQRAWNTLVRNRTARAGIITKGSRPLKHGEDGRGIGSRWYGRTLSKRLSEIRSNGGRIECVEGNALTQMEEMVRKAEQPVRIFADPPYEQAGRRLYTHGEVDHDELFSVLDDLDVDFLMTCEESERTICRVRKHQFHAVRVRTTNAHHQKRAEMIIGRKRRFT